MGLLDKVESVLTLGLIAVVGYLAYVNYDNIRQGFCKIPGAVATGWCGDTDTGKALECSLTMNDCWKVHPYAEVDTVNCKCVIPGTDIDQPGVCPTGSTWDYILKKCVQPPAEMEQCCNGLWQYKGTCLNGCVEPPHPGMKYCDYDGTWRSVEAVCPTTPPSDPMIFGCTDNRRTLYSNGQWKFLEPPQPCQAGAESSSDAVKTCGITRCFTGALIDTCDPELIEGGTVAACAGSAPLPYTCYEAHDRCAPLQMGAGGGYGFRTDLPCPSQYPIEIAPGTCVNAQQQLYTDCMRAGCPEMYRGY